MKIKAIFENTWFQALSWGLVFASTVWCYNEGNSEIGIGEESTIDYLIVFYILGFLSFFLLFAMPRRKILKIKGRDSSGDKYMSLYFLIFSIFIASFNFATPEKAIVDKAGNWKITESKVYFDNPLVFGDLKQYDTYTQISHKSMSELNHKLNITVYYDVSTPEGKDLCLNGISGEATATAKLIAGKFAYRTQDEADAKKLKEQMKSMGIAKITYSLSSKPKTIKTD